MSHQIERAFPSSLPKAAAKRANERPERNNVSHKPSPAEGQRACDYWNARWKVGQLVTIRCDDGTGIETTTRSAAWLVGGHTAAILLEGFAGCYLLSRVTSVVKEAA